MYYRHHPTTAPRHVCTQHQSRKLADNIGQQRRRSQQSGRIHPLHRRLELQYQHRRQRIIPETAPHCHTVRHIRPRQQHTTHRRRSHRSRHRKSRQQQRPETHRTNNIRKITARTKSHPHLKHKQPEQHGRNSPPPTSIRAPHTKSPWPFPPQTARAETAPLPSPSASFPPSFLPEQPVIAASCDQTPHDPRHGNHHSRNTYTAQIIENHPVCPHTCPENKDHDGYRGRRIPNGRIQSARYHHTLPNSGIPHSNKTAEPMHKDNPAQPRFGQHIPDVDIFWSLCHNPLQKYKIPPTHTTQNYRINTSPNNQTLNPRFRSQSQKGQYISETVSL